MAEKPRMKRTQIARKNVTDNLIYLSQNIHIEVLAKAE